jgi:hypothetical protein
MELFTLDGEPSYSILFDADHADSMSDNSVQMWIAMGNWGRRPLNDWTSVVAAYLLFAVGFINILIGERPYSNMQYGAALRLYVGKRCPI